MVDVMMMIAFIITLGEKCSNCVRNSLVFSYLASMSGVVCVVCPFADDEKLKNIHMRLVFSRQGDDTGIENVDVDLVCYSLKKVCCR